MQGCRSDTILDSCEDLLVDLEGGSLLVERVGEGVLHGQVDVQRLSYCTL